MKELMSFFFGSLFVVLFTTASTAQVAVGIKAGASLSVNCENSTERLLFRNAVLSA